MERAQRESLELGDDYIAPEHILLGLIRGGEGPAGELLDSYGADRDALRRDVLARSGHG